VLSREIVEENNTIKTMSATTTAGRTWMAYPSLISQSPASSYWGGMGTHSQFTDKAMTDHLIWMGGKTKRDYSLFISPVKLFSHRTASSSSDHKPQYLLPDPGKMGDQVKFQVCLMDRFTAHLHIGFSSFELLLL